MAAKKSATGLYRKAICPRCLGTGEYSRCQQWGTTCFKCGTKPGVPGRGWSFVAARVKDRYTIQLYVFTGTRRNVNYYAPIHGALLPLNHPLALAAYRTRKAPSTLPLFEVA